MDRHTDQSVKRSDILVYGATPGGIAAACCAADAGAKVLLVEASPFIGGHLTSGICTTECEHMLPISFGGWMVRFLRQIGRHYDMDDALHRWEPHVASQAYGELLEAAGVDLLTGCALNAVEKQSGRIKKAVLSDGSVVEAAVFIDASYEGDLMAEAGIPYAVGREPIEAYGESYAGIRFIDSIEEIRNSKGHAMDFDRVWEVDLLDPEGRFLEGVSPPEPDRLERGMGDGKVMNYHYRVTVTRAADRIPFPKPEHYREERYELLTRFLFKNPGTPLLKILGFLNHPSGQYRPGPDGFTKVIPGEKWELNNIQASIFSLGHLGGQFAYPDGNPEVRQAVLDDHKAHNAGLLYFLANSRSIPQPLREEARKWGLAPDEFVDNRNWPYQPYIRETRRMKGRYFLTQHDILDNRDKEDAIMWNSHWIDSHHVERVAIDANHFRNEGRIWHEITQPYAIPYRSILPMPEDASNLLVPGCVSASHVAFSSVRLESTWMGLGEAAGLAAALALHSDGNVQEIPIGNLQSALRESGVTL